MKTLVPLLPSSLRALSGLTLWKVKIPAIYDLARVFVVQTQAVIDDSMAQIHSHAHTSLLHQIAITAALTGDKQRAAER